MKEHCLQLQQSDFIDMANHITTTEVKINNKQCQVGDLLVLEEVIYREDGTYQITGNHVFRNIIYITDFMQDQEYVVLGITPICEKEYCVAPSLKQ